jgi:hypothetical protein
MDYGKLENAIIFQFGILGVEISRSILKKKYFFSKVSSTLNNFMNRFSRISIDQTHCFELENRKKIDF